MLWVVSLVLVLDNIRLRIKYNKTRFDLTKVAIDLSKLRDFLLKNDKDLFSKFIFTETEHGKALLGNMQKTSELLKEANEIK